MTSLMPNAKNPFLQDHSATSLLKKNYSVLLIQSHLKQNPSNYPLQYQPQPTPQYQQLQSHKQNHPTSLYNPFSTKSLNALELYHQRRDPGHLKSSQARPFSQTKNIFGSLDKNTFYKGLQDLGSKQIMKNQLERQARYQLKNYGVDSLRYQYVPMDNYTQRNYRPKQANPYTSVQRMSSKRIASNKTIETPKWNINVASEYYGYDGVKENKQEEDDFPIQKTKKTSFKIYNKNTTDKYKKQRPSYYQNISNIPEDRNEDFQTAHHIKLKPNLHDQLYSIDDQLYSGTSSAKIPSQKRISIENPQNFHPQSSASSGFGYSSQMYESGANFMTKFGQNKGGPLDTHAFDDEKQETQEFDLDQFEDIGKKSKKSIKRLYPDTLEHNNKIYYQIPL